MLGCNIHQPKLLKTAEKETQKDCFFVFGLGFFFGLVLLLLALLLPPLPPLLPVAALVFVAVFDIVVNDLFFRSDVDICSMLRYSSIQCKGIQNS